MNLMNALKTTLLEIPGRLFRLVRLSLARFSEDRCQRVAAALSFTTILSLVPLLTVGISAFSMFSGFEAWTERFQDLIYDNFVPAAGDAVSRHLRGFVQNAGRLTTVGLVFLLFASLVALSTIEDAFNDIWRVERGRSLIQRILVYWAVLSLGPLLIVASLSLSSYLLSLEFVSETAMLKGALRWMLTLVPFALELLAFLLLYVAVPNWNVPMRAALVGALFAAVLFEIAKRLFALYLLAFGSYEAIYGALATIPIFLIWVYLSWFIVLLGVELVVILSDGGKPRGPSIRPLAEPGADND